MKICTDLVIFEMILLHRKTHRAVEFANAYKKQTLVGSALIFAMTKATAVYTAH